jgi:hypothetical protein
LTITLQENYFAIVRIWPLALDVWKRKFVHTSDSKHDLPIAFLNLKMERVWQRQYANHAEAKADITNSSSDSTTASESIQPWAICRPPSTNGKWQKPTLSRCTKLLDHSMPPALFAAKFNEQLKAA